MNVISNVRNQAGADVQVGKLPNGNIGWKCTGCHQGDTGGGAMSYATNAAQQHAKSCSFR
jgi:hypothetical protein